MLDDLKILILNSEGFPSRLTEFFLRNKPWLHQYLSKVIHTMSKFLWRIGLTTHKL